VRKKQQQLRLPKVPKQPPRTPRLRFIEPLGKREGNPFFACRVQADLLRAFRAHARRSKVHPNELVREFMSKVTGVELDGEGDE
jgi:hypothetical protein